MAKKTKRKGRTTTKRPKRAAARVSRSNRKGKVIPSRAPVPRKQTIRARARAAAPGIPEGYRTATPRLVVHDAAAAIEFYKSAFGALEISTFRMPGGGVMHSQLQIGDSFLHLNDDMNQEGVGSPSRLNGTCACIELYVLDVDGAFRRALAAGAVEVMPVMDAFWGDRLGTLRDPFGHVWSIATRVRAMTPEEIQQAASAEFTDQQQPSP